MISQFPLIFASESFVTHLSLQHDLVPLVFHSLKNLHSWIVWFFFFMPLLSWKMMLWKCCTQYVSKFGKLSSGHRTGKGQFSFQSQRKAVTKNVQITIQCIHFTCYLKWKSESEVAQLCPSLSDPMDCSPPGSSIHGIFQARVLEWGAIAFSSYTHKVFRKLSAPLSEFELLSMYRSVKTCVYM